MKVIITGITGQLGWALKRTKPKEIEIIPCNRNLVDLKEEKSIIKFIEEKNPDWLINCAAYTNVDKAEKEKDLSKISGTPISHSHIFKDSFRPKKFVKDFFNKVINKLYKKKDYVPKLPKTNKLQNGIKLSECKHFFSLMYPNKKFNLEEPVIDLIKIEF